MTKSEDNPVLDSYRTSHASEGYGQHYSKTYEQGYYAHQWQLIEKPLFMKVLEQLKNRDSSKYLDFACGTGRILSVGEAFFEDSTGVDISADMLGRAKLNCTKSILIHQDITSVPLEDKYDVITAFRFFLNAEPALADDVLSAFHRMLPDDGGTVILNIHVNTNCPLGWFYELRNKIKGKTIANTKSLQQFEKVLENNGFAIERVYWYSFLPRTGWHFNFITKHLIVPVEKLFKLLPFLNGFSQCYLIQCKKL